jgi:hypothetical protein
MGRAEGQRKEGHERDTTIGLTTKRAATGNTTNTAQHNIALCACGRGSIQPNVAIQESTANGKVKRLVQGVALRSERESKYIERKGGEQDTDAAHYKRAAATRASATAVTAHAGLARAVLAAAKK